MVREIKTKGFGGIYIDASAYSDEDLKKLLKDLNFILKSFPIENSDGTIIYYSLFNYK